MFYQGSALEEPRSQRQLHFAFGQLESNCERRNGLMVNELDSGSSSPGSSPGWGQWVVFLGKTLNFHRASLHPGV